MGGCGEKEEYEERVIQLLKTEPEQAGERERERERERGGRESKLLAQARVFPPLVILTSAAPRDGHVLEV